MEEEIEIATGAELLLARMRVSHDMTENKEKY